MAWPLPEANGALHLSGNWVGVDGCRAGWFAVWAPHSSFPLKWAVYDSIFSLWEEHSTAAGILIDIPIGLPDRRYKFRECDRRARKILGTGLGSRVFPAPTREATRAGSYTEACAANLDAVGRKLSRQTYNICGKIAEVDHLLCGHTAPRAVICESHPELCFACRLNGCEPLRSSKKSAEGLTERLELLSAALPSAEATYEQVLKATRRIDVARDDILDALALLVSALSAERAFQVIPEPPPEDSSGLPMRMVY